MTITAPIVIMPMINYVLTPSFTTIITIAFIVLLVHKEVLDSVQNDLAQQIGHMLLYVLVPLGVLFGIGVLMKLLGSL